MKYLNAISWQKRCFCLRESRNCCGWQWQACKMMKTHAYDWNTVMIKDGQGNLKLFITILKSYA